MSIVRHDRVTDTTYVVDSYHHINKRWADEQGIVVGIDVELPEAVQLKINLYNIAEERWDYFADKAVNWVTGTPSKRKIQEWEEKYQDAGKYLKGDTSVDVSDYQEEADDEGITLEEMLQTYKTKGDMYRKLLRKVGNLSKKMERKANRDPAFNMEAFYWDKVAQFGLLFDYTE